ncbi:hypothetical protein [Kistimonas scapharcae]|uniref:hypothetical protein n=1 Tax=Kistimonas scapharcae TaxID=1036133 RepID=UPI0031EB24F6
MSDYTEMGRYILKTQPFSQFLGTELDALCRGWIRDSRSAMRCLSMGKTGAIS